MSDTFCPDKKRIKAFGCSHTAQHQWLWLALNNVPEAKFTTKEFWTKINAENEYRLGKYIGIGVNNNYNPCTWSDESIDMESWAMSGSGFDAQVCMWNTLLLNNNIEKEDIIIFQLTSPNRFTIPINDDSINYYGAKLKDSYKKGTLEKHGCFQLIEDEYFTGKRAYGFDPSCSNVLDIEKLTMNNTHNVYGQTGRLSELDPFRLHMILSSLLSIKSFNKKLLVIIGYEGSFWRKSLDRLFDAFDRFNINYIKTGMVDYARDNNYGVEKDGHSTQQGYKEFTNNMLKPKLEQLEWL